MERFGTVLCQHLGFSSLRVKFLGKVYVDSPVQDLGLPVTPITCNPIGDSTKYK